MNMYTLYVIIVCIPVKECLISYGVAASRIETEAKGEIDLGNNRESLSAIVSK